MNKEASTTPPENIFGTDGVRGRAGEGWLAADSLSRLGHALGGHFGQEGPLLVLIGRDPRSSGPDIEAVLATVLEADGAIVSVAGMVPTPAVSLLVQRGEFQLGIVISASHNPPEYNGVKVLDERGCKISVSAEREITRRFHAASPSEVRASARTFDPLYYENYCHMLKEVAAPAGLNGMKIALDCAWGATALLAPRIFAEAGAEVVSVCNEPDGVRINKGCGSLHPDLLQDTVKSNDCQLGIAFDGDGDRAIMVDGDGEVVDGDDMIALWANHLRERGQLPGDRVVATVMSNAGMERYLASKGIALTRSAVGDREVSEALEREGVVLGGEQSGHLIYTPEAMTGDGIRTGLHMACLVRNSGRALSELRAEVPRYPQVLLGIEVSSKPRLDELVLVREAEQHAAKILGADGRVFLRYSGTEPLARVLVEGPDADRNEELAQAIAAAIRRSIP